MKVRTIVWSTLGIVGISGAGILGGLYLAEDDRPTPPMAREDHRGSEAAGTGAATHPLTTLTADAELQMLRAEHERLERQLTDLRAQHGVNGPIEYPVQVSMSGQLEQYNRGQLILEISFLQGEIGKLDNHR